MINDLASLSQMKQSISVNVRVWTEVISHEYFLSFHLPKLQNGLALNLQISLILDKGRRDERAVLQG